MRRLIAPKRLPAAARTIVEALTAGEGLYNANDLSVPHFEVVTDGPRVAGFRTISDAHRDAIATAKSLMANGATLRTIWVNPGPDYRRGPIIFPPPGEERGP